MLSKWAERVDDRRVIEEFFDWLCAEKGAGDLLDVHIGKALDEYHGIDQRQLDKERRALLAACSPAQNNELITEILIDQLGCNEEQVVPHAILVADLAVDSLDMVELVMAFAESFNLEVTDEEVEKWRTVGDIQRAYVSAEQK